LRGERAVPVLDDVLQEINSTAAAWLAAIPAGEANSVAADHTSQWVATYTQRQLIQKMGEAYGCHTCNTKLADGEQWFIVDHIPPRGLFPTRTRTHYFSFFPHCDRCASEQATLVRQIRDGLFPKAMTYALLEWRGRRQTSFLTKVRDALKNSPLKQKQTWLLAGGPQSKYMEGHGNPPSSRDSAALNAWAKKCHSCGSKRANYFYHADHCPPKEFAMSGWFGAYMNAQLASEKKTKIQTAIAAMSYFRPQCPACSHSQGGRVNKIVNTAAKETVSTGLKRKSKAGRLSLLKKYGK
jgi:hypothetical protein